MPPADAVGGEHTVRLDPEQGRVLKTTRADVGLGYGKSYGHTSRGHTPSEYLDRLSVHNAVFNSGNKLEKIVPAADGKVAIVTSQPYVHGRDATVPEIQAMMQAKGFEHLGGTAYYHAEAGLLAKDLVPRNVRVSDSGRLHVLDAQVQRVTPAFADHVRPWFQDQPEDV